MDLSKLEKLLHISWTIETSSDSANWSQENPSWGQCAVTALIINDYMGGEIVWAEATLPDGKKISHYFNLIENQEIDLTRKQFPERTQIPKGIPKTKNYNTTREYVLSFPSTQNRYRLLKEKIENEI